MGAVPDKGWRKLRRTDTIVHPGGFGVSYNGKRWLGKDLPLLALMPLSKQEQSELYQILEMVEEEIRPLGKEYRAFWGMKSLDCTRLNEKRLNVRGWDFHKALDALYIALEGLRTLGIAQQNVTLLKQEPGPVYFTGSIDTSFRPLHPELRDFHRFLFTMKEDPQKCSSLPSKPMLALNNDSLEEVLSYTGNATVYNFENIPMYCARNAEMLSSFLQKQYAAALFDGLRNRSSMRDSLGASRDPNLQ